jgi:hypothetical protein
MSCAAGYTDTGCACERFSAMEAKSSYANGVGTSASVPKATRAMAPYSLVALLPNNPYV